MRVDKPVSSAVVQVKSGRQAMRLRGSGVSYGRSAINLTNGRTVELRAFRSTRKPQELADAIRMTYVAAEYVRYLRAAHRYIDPKMLVWGEFTRWVAFNHPKAFASLAGIETEPSKVRPIRLKAAEQRRAEAYSNNDFVDEVEVTRPARIRRYELRMMPACGVEGCGSCERVETRVPIMTGGGLAAVVPPLPMPHVDPFDQF
jgi:hypothetical protein